MQALVQDLRYAIRTLAKSPAWTFAAVACLAIGIGANTTVYTAMRAIVIAPVPTPNSDRLVMMAETPPRAPDDPDYDRIAPANLPAAAQELHVERPRVLRDQGSINIEEGCNGHRGSRRGSIGSQMQGATERARRRS